MGWEADDTPVSLFFEKSQEQANLFQASFTHFGLDIAHKIQLLTAVCGYLY